MEWMIYVLGALVVGAIALAVYERRKGLKLTFDDAPEARRDPKRRADVESERIRAEGNILQNIGGGDGSPD